MDADARIAALRAALEEIRDSTYDKFLVGVPTDAGYHAYAERFREMADRALELDDRATETS